MENLNTLAPWFAVAVAIASLLYSIFNGRSKDSAAKFDGLRKEVNDEFSDANGKIAVLAGKIDLAEDRISRAENELTHLPDKETTHRLELALAEMRIEMKGLSEQMKPINAIAARIQEGIFEKAGL